MESKKAFGSIKKKLAALMGDVSAMLAEDLPERDKQLLSMISIEMQAAYKNLLIAENVMFPAGALRKPKPPKIERIQYGEFGHVMMTAEEHQKLVAAYGEPRIREYTEKVDLYCESKNVSYPSGYATILNWLKRDKVQPQQTEQGNAVSNIPAEGSFDRILFEQFMNS